MAETTLQSDSLGSRNPAITIEVEADPTPLVKIFANKLKKASQQANFADLMKQAQGCFALKSNSDPQSLTFKIKGSKISLFSGIKPDAKIIVHTPLDETGSQKTHVEKLWRHPLFAMHVGRLLTFSLPNWVDSAKRFWIQNKDYPGMPDSIKIKCTDEDREFILGERSESSQTEMTLVGTAKELAQFLSGDSIFIQSAMSGKLHGTMSFEHAVVLSDISIQMLLGERG